MKNFKYLATYLVVCTMIFTSCSKEDATSQIDEQQQLVELDFSTQLTVFNENKSTKEHEAPECQGDDLVPTSVEVWIAEDVLGTNNTKYTIPLVTDSDGEFVTDPSQGVKLLPGTYQVMDFIVLSGSSPLWAAPHATGPFGNYVKEALPKEVVLSSGQKKYVNIEVLCYTPEQAEFFGFMFFEYTVVDIDSYCIFVNYCKDNRDYPAKYSVEVRLNDEDGDLINISGYENNHHLLNASEPSAQPLCIALPPLDNEDDNYYITVTVDDWDEVYGEATGNIEKSITVTQDMVEVQDATDPDEINHVIFECLPTFGDEPCVGEVQGASAGCEWSSAICSSFFKTAYLEGADANGYIFLQGDISQDPIKRLIFSNNVVVGEAIFSWDGSGLSVTYNMTNTDYSMSIAWGQVTKVVNSSLGEPCSERACEFDNCDPRSQRLDFTILEKETSELEGFFYKAKMCISLAAQ